MKKEKGFFEGKIFYLMIAFSFMGYSCKKDKISNEPGVETNLVEMDNLQVNESFNYETTNVVDVIGFVKAGDGTPLPNVPIKVFDKDTALGGTLILSGITDFNGKYEFKARLPKHQKQLYVMADYIGFLNRKTTHVSGTLAETNFGGTVTANKFDSPGMKGSVAINSVYKYLGTYTWEGVPNYLAGRDIIDADLLRDINLSLPEKAPVPTFNPEYISNGVESDMKLYKDAEVWMTFVHEGAGWKNSLGFYTYDLDNPPQTKEDIDSITIIFPNVSYKGDGGGLISGDKVKLGNFKANTGIGWVLIALGWYNGVRDGIYKHYSNPDFNMATTPEKRKYSVILNDKNRELFLLGFEDVTRDQDWCDNDFNDAVFYVTASPTNAIESSSYRNIKSGVTDSDNDGVADYTDHYPLDNTKAFNNYFPGKNLNGSLAFEDLWPFKGDYDFNDLVLDYNMNQITNANNYVVEIKGYFVVKAIGAGFHNGFGFQLDVDASTVKSVEGSILKGNYVSTLSNGVEAGQRKAVIILFDDAYNILQTSGGSSYVNTETNKPYVQPDTVDFTIKFKTPVSTANLSIPPYNPFIIKNKQREYEIHLPGYKPTDLANLDFLGTEEDDSNQETNKYFKTKNNLPWGIMLPYAFEYPVEGAQILKAHLKFANWAKSGGTMNVNWYLNESGFRDASKIYKK